MFLVTGGAGFIGSHLIDHLLNRGERILCLDDFNDFYDPAIKRRNIQRHLQYDHYRLIDGDIRNVELMRRIFRENAIDKVIHLAARAGVLQSVNQALLYEDVNVRGTMQLLELAARNKVGQFVYASSSSVYGGIPTTPFSEDAHISRTLSPYAASKYAAELMCHTYHHLYGIPITCLRFFTVYGPRQRPEMAIHKFTRMIHDGAPIPFFGDGGSARDYTFIGDIVQGTVAAIDRPFEFEVFNLGESFCVGLSDLVGLLEEVSGKKARLQRLPPQAGDVKITYADISKARRLLDYNPQTPIRTGLTRFMEWFEQEHTVRAMAAGHR